MTAADADRAKATEAEQAWQIVAPGLDGFDRACLKPTYHATAERVAAALAEARAPYNRLTADLRALAEELERADELVDVADRLRAVVAAATEGAIR